MNKIKEKLQQIWEFLKRKKKIFSVTSLSFFAAFFSFVIVFSGIYVTASRSLAIKHVRYGLSKVIASLNEVGLDIAYDKIEFNTVFFLPLVNIENLQIYNTNALNLWSVNFNNVEVFSNVIGDEKIRFKFSDGGNFVFNDFVSKMQSVETFLDVTLEDYKFKELGFHAEDVEIKDFAKINNIAFMVNKLGLVSNKEEISFPQFESFLEINNVDINGLLNYPLSQKINLFYSKANIIGKIKENDSILAAIEMWLKDGGFIDITNMILEWEPLTLVARGNVNFNENLSPRINLNTSSKGLMRLIKDLQENNFLENKNVFMANILLSNKAYKLKPEDSEMTISTPISYADGKIAVENLTIKDFNK